MLNLRIALVISAATLIAGVSRDAPAQSLATFGSAEAAGLGEGSLLLGISASGAGQGVVPVASIIGQGYRFRLGPNSTGTAWALSPSVGLQDNMQEGMLQAQVGYSFVSRSGGTGAVPSQVVGVQTGSSNSVFVIGQGSYWGSGENTAQLIASYAFNSEYYWTRGRASHRMSSGAQPVYLGAEAVLQGTSKVTPSAMRYQLGPTIEYRATPDFRLTFSGGIRGGNNNASSSGYVRIEFLALSKL